MRISNTSNVSHSPRHAAAHACLHTEIALVYTRGLARINPRLVTVRSLVRRNVPFVNLLASRERSAFLNYSHTISSSMLLLIKKKEFLMETYEYIILFLSETIHCVTIFEEIIDLYSLIFNKIFRRERNEGGEREREVQDYNHHFTWQYTREQHFRGRVRV